MATIRLTKEFRFEMAHILDGYDGPCRNVHGHSYVLFVTVIGQPNADKANPKLGMVMDFGELKRLVNNTIIAQFDHSLVISRDSSLRKVLTEGGFGKIVLVPFQPTCENLIPHFASLIKSELPVGVKLHHLKLYETASSYAEWFSSDNE